MQKVDSQEKFTVSDVPNSPLKVSDSIAEGVVNCLQELLRKCHVTSVDQVGRYACGLDSIQIMKFYFGILFT